MKTYRELYFRGNPKQLINFIGVIGKYAVGDWKCVQNSDRWKEYLFFDYIGEKVDKARVSIFIEDIVKLNKNELKVGNIIPLEKDELSVDEYNDILVKFYNDVIKPYKQINTEISISEPSDDTFDPTTVITEVALKKLEAFCNGANKSTGSSHPCDRERWFDFICQTVDDGRMIDASTLATFLKDEDYWGNKPDGYIGVIGKYAWDEDKAYELALEYESLCEIIEYYRRTRGI